MFGRAAVLMALCMVGLVNSKVSLVAPNPTSTPPTTTLVKQQNRVQPSIDGQATQRVKPTLNKGQFSRENERAKTTRKGPLRNTNTRNTLRNTIRRRKPTMVHPTSYLSLAISCHDAAIEVTTFRTS